MTKQNRLRRAWSRCFGEQLPNSDYRNPKNILTPRDLHRALKRAAKKEKGPRP